MLKPNEFVAFYIFHALYCVTSRQSEILLRKLPSLTPLYHVTLIFESFRQRLTTYHLQIYEGSLLSGTDR